MSSVLATTVTTAAIVLLNESKENATPTARKSMPTTSNGRWALLSPPVAMYAGISWKQGWQRLVDSQPVWTTTTSRKARGSTASISTKHMHSRWRGLWVLECGSAGNCMFDVVAAGYNYWHSQQPLLQQSDVRALAASALTEDNVDSFLDQSSTSDGFHPKSLKKRFTSVKDRVNECRRCIRQSGNTYWGETTTLLCLLRHALLMRQERLGFLVLTDFRSRGEPRFWAELYCREDTSHCIGLYSAGDQTSKDHWMLLGYLPDEDERSAQRGPMQCVWPVDHLPNVVRNLVSRDLSSSSPTATFITA